MIRVNFLKKLRDPCLVLLAVIAICGIATWVVPQLVHAFGFTIWLLAVVALAIIAVAGAILFALSMQSARLRYLIIAFYHALMSDFWAHIAKHAINIKKSYRDDSLRVKLAKYAYQAHNGHGLLCDVAWQFVYDDTARRG